MVGCGAGVSAAVTLPVGRLARSSSDKSAAMASSALSVRLFSTSAAAGSRGAVAWWKSYFTARGKQAAIFTGPPLASRASAG